MTVTGRVQAAFTLFETMLALALTVVLLAATLRFLYDIGVHRENLLTHARRDHDAACFIERIESDLLCSFAGDGAAGVGIQGDRVSLTLLTRAVELDRNPASGALSDVIKCHVEFDAGTIKYSRAAIGSSISEVPAEPIVLGVAELAFRYFDDRAWKSQFDSSERERLPAAIEVCVWFGKTSKEKSRVPRSAPDFSRIIAIADGPGAAWKEGK